MQATPRRNGYIILAFVLAMFIIVTLAFSSTTWAAPNSQGTVPTAPASTRTAPTTVPPDNNGGDNGNNNGGDNGNNQSDNSNNGGNQGGDTGGTAPVAPGSGSVCAIGDAGAQCSVQGLSIIVAAGATSAGSALTIEGSFPQPPCPPSPSGQIFLDRCFRYSWIGTKAEALSAINAPVQYCISYGTAQLAAAKNDAASLLIGVAGQNGTWTMLKPVVDSTGSRTCATSNQLIVWTALFAPKSASDLLPTVGAPLDNMWLVGIVGVGIVLLLGAARLRKQARN